MKSPKTGQTGQDRTGNLKNDSLSRWCKVSGDNLHASPQLARLVMSFDDIMMCIKCMIIIMMDGHDFLGVKRGNEKKVKEMWSIMEACGLKNNTCLLHRAAILTGRLSAVGTFLAMQ